MKAFLLMFTVGLMTSFSAFSQVDTNDIDLRRREHVPLYDCSILRSYNDQNTCLDLSRLRYNNSFGNQGYAVNCREFNRGVERRCLELASNLTYGNGISCSGLYRGREERQCEITREAYRRGYFENQYGRRSSIETSVVVTSPSRSTVVSSTPVYQTTCDDSAYDRAYDRWLIKTREQRERGTKLTVVGGITAIGGLILGQSRNSTVRDVGTGMVIGGAVLATFGMIELADAGFQAPHLVEYCSSEYIGERRMVMVERRECETTRYTHRSRGRSYYEVRCERKNYIVFDRFDPWDNGRAF